MRQIYAVVVLACIAAFLGLVSSVSADNDTASLLPSIAPSTSRPTRSPSNRPTTARPSKSPSKAPTTSKPSHQPTTTRPSKTPSKAPTTSPTKKPTSAPSKNPSIGPSTSAPSKSPSTSRPTRSPSIAPTSSPTRTPTTSLPTASPSTSRPTQNPTTSRPTRSPNNIPPNVLLIMIDDLKPVLSAYNSPLLPPQGTPNMDRIVNNGLSFMNAHAQMSLCGPSRSSFLTSQRPDTLGIYSLTRNALYNRIQKSIRRKREILTMPKIFKMAGYNTYGIGKVFHENEFVMMQKADTWTVPVYTWLSNMKRPPSFTQPYIGPWINEPDVADDYFADGQAARLAAELITDVLSVAYTTKAIPWFLAVGLWKPHLPWYAPQKYFDECGSYENFNGPFSTTPTVNLAPVYFNLVKGQGCGETALYTGGPKLLSFSSAPLDSLKEANRAYHAATIYMDAQVGLILDALDNSTSSDSTIVVLLGDHGFHLGDKGLYCKHTNFEQATKVPFVISPPKALGTTVPRNRRTYAPVELLDLLPTLYEMTKLKLTLTKYAGWQGTSLMPLIQDPDNGFVKQAAISQYPRGKGSGRVMGYSVRTVRYRYTNWGNGKFEELYDYLNDYWETTTIHGKDPTLKKQIIANGYNNKQFGTGIGKMPIDFSDRFNMLAEPAQTMP